jgi:hypothetical protein
MKVSVRVCACLLNNAESGTGIMLSLRRETDVDNNIREVHNSHAGIQTGYLRKEHKAAFG